MAGGIVTEAAARHGVAILPVDSEHNAIHQCLHGRASGDVKRLVLTASGGPFRGRQASDLEGVTAADALKHPTWQMGRKITIDSATLMNKGLEVIEAHWLFGMDADRRLTSSFTRNRWCIDGRADRRLDHRAARRHRHAAADSVRVFLSGSVDRADATAGPNARRAARVRGAGHRERSRVCASRIGRSRPERSLPVVLNAANEVAVALFLDGRLGFTDIAEVIERTMDAHRPGRGRHPGCGARGRPLGARAAPGRLPRGLELRI